LLSATATPSFAQQGPQITVLTADNNPLPSLASSAAAGRIAAATSAQETEVKNFYPEGDTRTIVGAAPLGQDPLLLPFQPSGPATVADAWDGIDNTDQAGGFTPPDTNGEVGPNHFVEMINVSTVVYDKNGNELGGGPFPNTSFWTGFGGVCESTNRGDPVVLYDEQNDRWMVSHFAFNTDGGGNPASPFLQCVAVSQTSDPLGAYNRYAWNFDAIGFNDYPHFGISTNAIGVSLNIFSVPGFGFAGTWIGTIDRACVLAGTSGCVLVGGNLGSFEFGYLPFDMDDPTGAAGFVPAQFGTAMTATGLFDVWTITPDFVTPGNSTIIRTSRVPIATFDSDICPATRERCITHPGSGVAYETLSGRLMHKSQLVNFGTHLSMVAAHTIDVDAAAPGVAGRAGIRWYEFRSLDSGGTWTLHQEGTHGPADTLHRWMPSIAMNQGGDIGIGFMVSNTTTAPAIYVTGQSAGSGGNRAQIGAPGVFDVDETVCRAGVLGGDWSGRSGDYSATSVDPGLDTFYHVNEYGRSNVGFGPWGTAVCEFQLPPPSVYVLDGYGGVNSGGGAPVMSPATPYFGFDVARDLELASTGYYVLDGWGGLHAGGGAPVMAGPPYFGFDASADFELAPTGNYALDIFGGVHANAGAPVLNPATPYFGFDAARDFELAPTGYYVFDAWGGFHLGGGAAALSPLPPYFGFDASEDIEVTPTGAYALDSFGGVHVIGGAPAVLSPPPYFGFDAARDMELAGSGIYVLDAWGGLHAANGASVISPAPPYYGFDIAKDLEIR
jgi:hypothetical protein